jgi:hypothetical protein
MTPPPPNMPQPPGMAPPGMGHSGMTTTHGMPMKGGNKMYGGNKMMMGGRRTKKAKKGKGFFNYLPKFPKKFPKLFGGADKMPAVGSKASVFHGKAKHTSGGLTRKDLMKTKHGRIVSRKKHALGKKALKNLVKAGFKAKKGTFKLFRK